MLVTPHYLHHPHHPQHPQHPHHPHHLHQHDCPQQEQAWSPSDHGATPQTVAPPPYLRGAEQIVTAARSEKEEELVERAEL